MKKNLASQSFLWFAAFLFVTRHKLSRGFQQLHQLPDNIHRANTAAISFQPRKAASLSAAAAATDESTDNKPQRRRDRFLNRLGFRRLSQDQRTIREVEAALAQQQNATRTTYRIDTVEDLEAYFTDEEGRFRKTNGDIDYNALLQALDVRGDTQIIGSPDRPDYKHPVAQLLHERKATGYSKKAKDDGAKIALAIEGGGMRGCISAGMVCAIHYLNLTSCFDVVYGSSAGTVVGSYMITRQLPWFGPEVYYDRLTTAGRDFIDTRRILRAIGFGLLDPRLYKDVLTRPHHGKPVLNLPYLLQTTMQETKPLDWDKFVEEQKRLPLKVVVSGLKSEKSLALDYEGGFFKSLSDLTNCMHASCLLPGIAGPLMNIDLRTKRIISGNNMKDDHYEPLADALVYEPLPYRSAIKEGCTHIVVVRSRPDGVDVTGKGSFLESLIFRRFFLRKNRLPHVFRWMKRQCHKKIYAEDILRLNADAASTRHYKDTSRPHLFTMALPPGSPEVTRLETGREAIFEGIRRGFARAYDCLVEDPRERGRGMTVAKEFFPDQILDYDPTSIDVTNESAFAAYLRASAGTAKQI